MERQESVILGESKIKGREGIGWRGEETGVLEGGGGQDLRGPRSWRRAFKPGNQGHEGMGHRVPGPGLGQSGCVMREEGGAGPGDGWPASLPDILDLFSGSGRGHLRSSAQL